MTTYTLCIVPRESQYPIITVARERNYFLFLHDTTRKLQVSEGASEVGFARSSCFRAFGAFGLFRKLSGFRFGLSVPFLLRDLIKMCDIYFLALQIELSMLLYTEMKHYKEQLELRNPYQYLKYKFLLKCINSL